MSVSYEVAAEATFGTSSNGYAPPGHGVNGRRSFPPSEITVALTLPVGDVLRINAGEYDDVWLLEKIKLLVPDVPEIRVGLVYIYPQTGHVYEVIAINSDEDEVVLERATDHVATLHQRGSRFVERLMYVYADFASGQAVVQYDGDEDDD